MNTLSTNYCIGYMGETKKFSIRGKKFELGNHSTECDGGAQLAPTARAGRSAEGTSKC